MPERVFFVSQDVDGMAEVAILPLLTQGAAIASRNVDGASAIAARKCWT